jgi:hypothetical protein
VESSELRYPLPDYYTVMSQNITSYGHVRDLIFSFPLVCDDCMLI